MSKKAAQKEVARRLYKKGDGVRDCNMTTCTGYVSEDESPDRTTGLVSVLWFHKTEPELRLWSEIKLCSEATAFSIESLHEMLGTPALHRNVISTEFSNDALSDYAESELHTIAQQLILEDKLRAAVLEEGQPAREGSHVLVSPTKAIPAEEYNRSHGLVIKDSLTRSHAPANKPLTATLAQRGVQLSEASDAIKVRGNKHLGHRMCEYSDGMEDAIYKVGALFFREQSVSLSLAYTAYSALLAFYKHNRTPHARRVLTDLIACIKEADVLFKPELSALTEYVSR